MRKGLPIVKTADGVERAATRRQNRNGDGRRSDLGTGADAELSTVVALGNDGIYLRAALDPSQVGGRSRSGTRQTNPKGAQGGEEERDHGGEGWTLELPQIHRVRFRKSRPLIYSS
jgi:hypothetical protein